ncbi:MAG: phosphotransferase [Nocardioides sp.]|nr:phosphotransferase [Nocardioides sp.]
MVAVHGRKPVAVLKVRDRAKSLEREQEALASLERLAPHTFSAPRPMGHGVAGPWYWSAQEVVFRRPHRPVLEAAPAFFEEVSAALAGLLPATGDGVPAHGDLTPWNLRRDHRGRVWLFDWEDWGLAPVDADRAYFSACSRAVGGPPMPTDLAPGAVAHHRPVIETRRRNASPGVTLPDQILAAFDEVEGR